jgi:hypothetical protein
VAKAWVTYRQLPCFLLAAVVTLSGASAPLDPALTCSPLDRVDPGRPRCDAVGQPPRAGQSPTKLTCPAPSVSLTVNVPRPNVVALWVADRVPVIV